MHKQQCQVLSKVYLCVYIAQRLWILIYDPFMFYNCFFMLSNGKIKKKILRKKNEILIVENNACRVKFRS